MNIKDLRYLVAISEEQHFGRAAAACNISQPTLSMQLKKLEEYLGLPLVERSNNRVIMTEMGNTVVTKARKIISDYDSLIETARAKIYPGYGTLRIGIISTLGQYLLPYVLWSFRVAFPNLELIIHEDYISTLLEKVKIGELDCIIAPVPYGEDINLEGRTLFTEHLMLLMHKDHELAKKAELKIEDLQDQNIITLNKGHCLRNELDALLENVKGAIRTNFCAHNLETIRAMVAAGTGISIMPSLAAKNSNNTLYDQKIETRFFTTSRPTREIAMYWRNSSFKKETIDTLIKIIKTAEMPLKAD